MPFSAGTSTDASLHWRRPHPSRSGCSAAPRGTPCKRIPSADAGIDLQILLHQAADFHRHCGIIRRVEHPQGRVVQDHRAVINALFVDTALCQAGGAAADHRCKAALRQGLQHPGAVAAQGQASDVLTLLVDGIPGPAHRAGPGWPSAPPGSSGRWAGGDGLCLIGIGQLRGQDKARLAAVEVITNPNDRALIIDNMTDIIGTTLAKPCKNRTMGYFLPGSIPSGT